MEEGGQQAQATGKNRLGGSTVRLLKDRLTAAGVRHLRGESAAPSTLWHWSKMRHQAERPPPRRSIDVAALRILTEDVEGCYLALAVVQTLSGRSPAASRLNMASQAERLPVAHTAVNRPPPAGGKCRSAPTGNAPGAE